MISRRERLTWALVFAVPPGVGIAIATARVSGDPITTPLALGAFAVTTVVLFALVYGAATINQGDPAAASGHDAGDARDATARDAEASDAGDSLTDTETSDAGDSLTDTETSDAGDSVAVVESSDEDA